MDYMKLSQLLFPQVTDTPETLEEKLICLADKFFSKGCDRYPYGALPYRFCPSGQSGDGSDR